MLLPDLLTTHLLSEESDTLPGTSAPTMPDDETQMVGIMLETDGAAPWKQY